jgi:hypothetical protein
MPSSRVWICWRLGDLDALTTSDLDHLRGRLIEATR